MSFRICRPIIVIAMTSGVPIRAYAISPVPSDSVDTCDVQKRRQDASTYRSFELGSLETVHPVVTSITKNPFVRHNKNIPTCVSHLQDMV